MISEVEKITLKDLAEYVTSEMNSFKHSNRNEDPKHIYLRLEKILKKVEALQYWEANNDS